MSILRGRREFECALWCQNKDGAIEVRSRNRSLWHGIVVLDIQNRLDGHCQL